VLDCEYTLAPEEEGAGLVVKWFFNSQPAPVYQWIPGKKPQVKGCAPEWVAFSASLYLCGRYLAKARRERGRGFAGAVCVCFAPFHVADSEYSI
jgi:hypothetical protein